MIQAQPHLCSAARLRTDRADAAQSDVNRLLELYRRRPSAGCNNPIIVPAAYHPASAMQPYDNNHPSTETNPNSMDPQLIEYTKEQAVTWEDLKTRPPLFPGEDGGIWQFSTAEEVIRSWH